MTAVSLPIQVYMCIRACDSCAQLIQNDRLAMLCDSSLSSRL